MTKKSAQEDTDGRPPCCDVYTVGPWMRKNVDVPTADILKVKDIDPLYLFTEAARFDLVERMEELVADYGVDINGLSKGIGQRALPSACEGNSLAAIDWLLKHGADPDSYNVQLPVEGIQEEEWVSALWLAAEVGNVRSANLLLEAGANANTCKKATGNSALCVAAQNGHKAMIALLLSHGADPNLKGNDYGQSPLVIAAAYVRNDVVAQLINAGATITAPDAMMLKKLIQQMRKMRKPATQEYTREVKEYELDELEELLDLTHVTNLMANVHYKKARKMDQKRKYREALKLLQVVPPSIADLQLKRDIERNVDFVYGIKGSDGRTSVWTQLIQLSETLPQPLQFSAWVRFGRKLLVHGGHDFTSANLMLRRPCVDELWEFDLDARTWRMLPTFGKGPGKNRTSK